MNYLKCQDVHFGNVFRQEKYGYNSKNDKIPWKALGFDTLRINSRAVQLEQGALTYLPISDEAKLGQHIEALQADAAALGGSFEIVAEDRDVWLAAGTDDQQTRNATRDQIIASASVNYDGALISMTPSDIVIMDQITETIDRRNKSVKWKAKDAESGAIVRKRLKKKDIQAIKDAVFDASQIVHEQSDTETPTSPWPVIVEKVT